MQNNREKIKLLDVVITFLEMEVECDPIEIERKSYEIIRRRLPNIFGGDEEYDIAVRVAHATGDIEFAMDLRFHPDFVKSAKSALLSGLPIFVDVEMAKVAIKGYAEAIGVDVICAVNDPDVVRMAKELGVTRSAAAVRKVLREIKTGLVVCGNSPTFLYELIRICETDQGIKPMAVIGIPVGFVSSVKVKRHLRTSQILPFMTNNTTKGGTPAAVASAIHVIKAVKLLKDQKF